jgi:hypothetical protein
MNSSDFAKEFVMRHEPCIQRVFDSVKDILSGKETTCTYTFTGERGIGKSWLLRYFEHFFKGETQGKVSVFLIDLIEYKDKDPALAVRAMLQDLNKDIFASDQIPDVRLDAISRAVVNHISALPGVFILLVDSVYESRWELLEYLETYLLGPLAIGDNSLLVLAGRGQPYPWSTPELGIKRAETCSLTHFDKDQTDEQLQRLIETRDDITVFDTDHIFQISEGNPLFNRSLAEQKSQTEMLDAVINDVLANVPLVVEDAPYRSRETIIQSLKALCILESFKEDRIGIMLAAYTDDDTYRNWNYGQARKVREALTNYGLAAYEEKKNGYVIDDAVRKLFEKSLAHEAEKWRVMHCTAYNLYQSWAKDYERTKDFWQKQASYHAKQLKTKGIELSACAQLQQTAATNAGAGAVK